MLFNSLAFVFLVWNNNAFNTACIVQRILFMDVGKGTYTWRFKCTIIPPSLPLPPKKDSYIFHKSHQNIFVLISLHFYFR